MKALFRRFKRIGYSLLGNINFIDIGAAGNFPYPWNKNLTKIRHLLTFDPNEEAQTDFFLNKLNIALWDEECERNLYIYKGRGGSGSSLFKQNFKYVNENFSYLRDRGPKILADTWYERSQLERVKKITCRKLDNVLKDQKLNNNYHFMKIDAQGAEYQILKGSENFLSQNCLGLHLELFVLPLYEGIYLLPDVEKYLKQYNFDLVKKYPASGTFDSQHDCVFLKKEKNKIIDTICHIYNISYEEKFT